MLLSFRISNPRKGTETFQKECGNDGRGRGFRISNPRKGTETTYLISSVVLSNSGFRISNPRKGTETGKSASFYCFKPMFPHI